MRCNATAQPALMPAQTSQHAEAACLRRRWERMGPAATSEVHLQLTHVCEGRPCAALSLRVCMFTDSASPPTCRARLCFSLPIAGEKQPWHHPGHMAALGHDLAMAGRGCTVG